MTKAADYVVSALERVLEDLAESTRASQEVFALWRVMDEAGFAQALLPEEDGGAAMGWRDASGMLAALAHEAVPSPLPEAMVAQWLVARTDPANLADGLAVFADGSTLQLSGNGGSRVTGRLHRVPWARHAERIITVVPRDDGAWELVAIEAPRTGEIARGSNLAGEARDDVVLAARPVTRIGTSPVDADGLRALGAAVRSVQISAAMHRVLDLTVAYANLREQFGRPIARFQAVQHPVAQLAASAAAAQAAAQAAMEEIDAFDAAGELTMLGASLQVASAKVFCGEAAGQAASISHQAFGAIGFTSEHSLHHFTRRLWSWRDEYGSEAWWSRRIGTAFCAAGGSALWPALTRARLREAVL